MARTSNLPVTVRPARSGDLAGILRLLTEADLPLDGVSENLDGFLVVELHAVIAAAIGCEAYGEYGLLRSAVVTPPLKGQGIGHALTDRILDQARSRKLRALYLLTTTAQEFFPRFGFERITREQVPAAVRQSVEFRGACPDSAIVMRRML